MIYFHYLYLSNKMIHIPFMYNINVFNDDDDDDDDVRNTGMGECPGRMVSVKSIESEI